MGLSVPDDVSVTGFDNRSWTEFSSPALTTVHYPREEVGACAAEILIQKIKGTLPLNNYQAYQEEPNLIIRESVRKIN